jgi:hypothetical protein
MTELGYCDNTDCPNVDFNNESKHIKVPLFLVVLHRDFNFDICFWCKDCIEIDESLIFMTELDLIRYKELRHKINVIRGIVKR